MTHLRAESGIALCVGIMVFTGFLAVLNFWRGNQYLGALNLVLFGAGGYLLGRWVAILKIREFLGRLRD